MTNRADAALLLCRVMGLDESEAATEDPFKDVKKDNVTYAGCLAQLKAEGVAKGNNIIRAEFIALAMRAYSSFLDGTEKTDFDAALNAKEPKASFEDVDTKADWFANVAYVAKDKGFVKGKNGKLFDGKADITRSEATVILYRIFNDML